MLQDPYPNAYIKGCDGKKIYIIKATIESQLNKQVYKRMKKIILKTF